MSDFIDKALKAKRESKHVEFKEKLDPNSAHDWCEIIKDIVAISNSGGGIILFGVDNFGNPCGFPIEPIKNLDSADVTDKISKYTGAVDLQFDICEVKKGKTKLIAFLIHAVSIPIVFQKPGTYSIDDRRQRTAFSVGTVYFRHGAKSEPGTSDDIGRVIERQLELIRKSWIKGVRKVVQAPQGSQVITVQTRGTATSTIPLATNVHAVNDPNATPVILTRDRTKASGIYMHEEVSEGIFDEINNVVDVNTILAKGQQHFVLGLPVYYRIYAERQHVQQADSNISLLLQSAVTELYAPGLYWAVTLPVKIIAQIFADLYLHPKSPHIHGLLRIAILLGKEFSEWLYGKWHEKWKRHPQPPSFYWAFKDMILKLDKRDRQLIAARAVTTTQYTINGTTSPRAKELIEKPEQAATLLSKVCMLVFEGRTELRTIARDLDYLAYGGEVKRQSAQITKAIIKQIGDLQAGDITEDKGEE